MLSSDRYTSEDKVTEVRVEDSLVGLRATVSLSGPLHHITPRWCCGKGRNESVGSGLFQSGLWGLQDNRCESPRYDNLIPYREAGKLAGTQLTPPSAITISSGPSLPSRRLGPLALCSFSAASVYVTFTGPEPSTLNR